jgi:hypothetical protein
VALIPDSERHGDDSDYVTFDFNGVTSEVDGRYRWLKNGWSLSTVALPNSDTGILPSLRQVRGILYGVPTREHGYVCSISRDVTLDFFKVEAHPSEQFVVVVPKRLSGHVGSISSISRDGEITLERGARAYVERACAYVIIPKKVKGKMVNTQDQVDFESVGGDTNKFLIPLDIWRQIESREATFDASVAVGLKPLYVPVQTHMWAQLFRSL